MQFPACVNECIHKLGQPYGINLTLILDGFTDSCLHYDQPRQQVSLPQKCSSQSAGRVPHIAISHLEAAAYSARPR